MQLSDLRSLVYYWTDDAQGIKTGIGTYFTPIQVNAFLNNARLEVQKQLLQAAQMFYLTVSETTTVTNQQDYILPTDFLKIHRIELVLSGTGVNENRWQLQRITLNQKDDILQQSGNPTCYSLGRNRISLYPVPTTTLPLRLYYSYRTAAMVVDTDVPDCPEEFQEFIACLAALDCFVKDDRAPQNLLTKIEAYKALLKQMAQERAEDSPRMVRTSDEGGYGSLY